MSLDIHTAVQTALLIIILVIVVSIWRGITSIRSARHLPFFRMRRDRMIRGWRLLMMAMILIILAVFLNSQIEPTIYRFFPPTATVTLTPTMTVSPTITITPSITLTPTISPSPEITDTPTITPTPFVPLAIETRFESTITPNPDAVFSELSFTDGLDALYRPLNPGEVFQNPIEHMYAVFSYDGMINGSQWTALWYRDGELVHFETLPWDGDTGGLGYTDWEPSPDVWLPGEYEVQIFIGLIWKISGRFIVEGDPPTPVPSLTPTLTPTQTNTPTPTRTPRPTQTPTPSLTPRPSRTYTPVPTNTLTRTPYDSPTPTPSRTLWPTQTRTPITPSITPQPTLTRTTKPTPYPTLTQTPITPSITPQPTLTRTITPSS